HVTRIAELGFLARSLAGQQRFGIGGGLMSIVAALLAVEIDAAVAGIVIGRGIGCALVFALEALVPRPRLDQRAVNREVLIRKQTLRAGLLKHRLEKPLCDSALQQ